MVYIFDKTITNISQLLKRELDLNDDDEAVVKYSLTIYTTTIIGYLAMIIVALPFGVVKFTMVSAITTSLLRIFSGGAHASCSRNCILSGAIIFPAFGLITNLFTPVDVYVFLAAALAWIYVIWMVYKYSPADTPGKPINTVKQKSQLRQRSFTVLLIWGVIVTGAGIGLLSLSQNVVFASTLGLLWQGFSLTPVGYKLVEKVDYCFTLKEGIN